MPAPTASPPPRATAAPVLRRHLLQLVVAVLAVHAAFIALHRALGVEQRPRGERTTFVLVWTAATLAAVLIPMARIRAARLRARHERARSARGR